MNATRKSSAPTRTRKRTRACRSSSRCSVRARRRARARRSSRWTARGSTGGSSAGRAMRGSSTRARRGAGAAMARDSCRSPGVPQAAIRPIAGSCERDNASVSGAPASVSSAQALQPGDEAALEAFAAAALELVRDPSVGRAVGAVTRAVALAVGAQVVIARIADPRDGRLAARAVHADSAALAAELEGTKVSPADMGQEEAAFTAAAGDPSAPVAVRRTAARAGAPIARIIPVVVEGDVVASLELYRSGLPFGLRERALARVAAAHLATAVRLERVAQAGGDGRLQLTQASLELLGEALAAGADEGETAEQVVRLAAEATHAGALLWRLEAEAAPSLLSFHGLGER